MKGENKMCENSEHKEMRSLYSEDNVSALKRKYLTDNMDNLQIIDVGSRNDRCGKKHKEVPIWEKSNLTLEEAAAYFGIGMNKLRSMTEDESCPFVLWNGCRRLIKRRKLDEFLENAYSI